MAYLGDYHTHTTYSRRKDKLHAVGSVLENARIAKAAGLVELAVTDHGYAHYYGISDEEAFERLKADCEKAEKDTGVKIYAGLEYNLDYRSGKDKSLPALIDGDGAYAVQIVQGGYHAMVPMPTFIKNMLFWARNVIFKFLPGRKKLIARNTAAYKRLIDEYPIDFIGHLNRGIMADAVEVAKYAHERGVYIELNGRHKSLNKREIAAMVEAGVEFICSSDAHESKKVGQMPCADKIIKKYNIPYSLIANWDRLPSFRSDKFKAARESKNIADNTENDG